MEFPPYQPGWPLRNGHANTIYSFLSRKSYRLPYQRERFHTPDEDFFEVDWLKKGVKRAAVILHGLEASSKSTYILSMAKLLHEADWDVAAINYRSCGGEMNRQARVYHAGATDDVKLLVDRVCELYEEVVIVGYSLGANLALKFAGEQATSISPNIKALAAVSVPLDLVGSSHRISYDRASWLYQRMFLISLMKKARLKHKQFPEIYSQEKMRQVKTLYDFDELFTGPVHGFGDALGYYQTVTALNFLDKITVPSLVIIAQDDPFFSEKRWETHLQGLPNIHLLAPKFGGHVGFSHFLRRENWMEQQVMRFFGGK